MLTVRSALRGFTRSFKTTAVNKSDHGPEGFPGAVSKKIMYYSITHNEI